MKKNRPDRTEAAAKEKHNIICVNTFSLPTDFEFRDSKVRRLDEIIPEVFACISAVHHGGGAK